VEREPRLVHVYAHEIKRIALPEIDFRVVCSKGFYVRTYAHDVGQALGCGGHLSSLRRTRSGRFTLARAVGMADLMEGKRDSVLQKLLSLPEVSRLRGA
jgi:tRNA pseudouridine55 synthase